VDSLVLLYYERLYEDFSMMMFVMMMILMRSLRKSVVVLRVKMDKESAFSTKSDVTGKRSNKNVAIFKNMQMCM